MMLMMVMHDADADADDGGGDDDDDGDELAAWPLHVVDEVEDDVNSCC